MGNPNDDDELVRRALESITEIDDDDSSVKLRALDLFCGAGGVTKGLQMAGFEVTGVDINPQPEYCGENFIQEDALWFASQKPGWGRMFDFIWASPPCQGYTAMQRINTRTPDRKHPKLIGPVREMLADSGSLYCIENVPGAPLKNPVTLCGSTFDLGVRRHRLFEANFDIPQLPCNHKYQGRSIAVYGDHPQEDFNRHKQGHVQRARTLKEGQNAMGIDWMKWKTLTQAIPPAYSKFIGMIAMRQIKLKQLSSPVAAE